MTKKQKKMLTRIIAAAVLLILLNFLPVTGIIRFVLFLIPYLIVGYDILKKAWKGILNRQVFDENFLMAVATVGAIAIAFYEKSGDFNEAVAVMLFYQFTDISAALSNCIALEKFTDLIKQHNRLNNDHCSDLNFIREKKCQSTVWL